MRNVENENYLAYTSNNISPTAFAIKNETHFDEYLKLVASLRSSPTFELITSHCGIFLSRSKQDRAANTSARSSVNQLVSAYCDRSLVEPIDRY